MQDNNWLSVHIFYHNNNNPLIVDCIKPLVDELRAFGLIKRYFFIKYWMEGPHVRLRLLPAAGVSHEELKAYIEPPISAYLYRQPSLLMVDAKALQPIYKDLFAAEYGNEKWEAIYGKEGSMPVRPNNSFDYIEYEPEYARYGGQAGIELAEWHFEHSSDTTIWLLQETNTHVKTVLLGLSAQLMLHLCYGLLRDEQKVLRFLDNYAQSWLRPPYQQTVADFAQFEKRAVWNEPDLQWRVGKIRDAVLSDSPARLTAFERTWYTHVRELRQRILQLVAEKQLVSFSPLLTKQGVIDDPDVAMNILLHGYVHMTNNRLGANIFHEVYLSYVVKRCLEEKTYAGRDRFSVAVPLPS